MIHDVLSDVVATYGVDVLSDPFRCRGLLSDTLGAEVPSKRSLDALVAVAAAGGPSRLAEASDAAGEGALLSRELQTSGMAPDAAEWAVAAWVGAVRPDVSTPGLARARTLPPSLIDTSPGMAAVRSPDGTSDVISPARQSWFGAGAATSLGQPATNLSGDGSAPASPVQVPTSAKSRWRSPAILAALATGVVVVLVAAILATWWAVPDSDAGVDGTDEASGTHRIAGDPGGAGEGDGGGDSDPGTGVASDEGIPGGVSDPGVIIGDGGASGGGGGGGEVPGPDGGTSPAEDTAPGGVGGGGPGPTAPQVPSTCQDCNQGFADRVAHANLAPEVAAYSNNSLLNLVLGPKDAKYISIGSSQYSCQGTIPHDRFQSGLYMVELEFSDNRLYDGDGDDLVIHEYGKQPDGSRRNDPSDVFVSVDAVTWYKLGRAAGGSDGLDMRGIVPANDYRFVRICDVPDGGGGGDGGVDVDAVQARNARINL